VVKTTKNAVKLDLAIWQYQGFFRRQICNMYY
jgi:hypothetical protein